MDWPTFFIGSFLGDYLQYVRTVIVYIYYFCFWSVIYCILFLLYNYTPLLQLRKLVTSKKVMAILENFFKTTFKFLVISGQGLLTTLLYPGIDINWHNFNQQEKPDSNPRILYILVILAERYSCKNLFQQYSGLLTNYRYFFL